MKLWLSTLCFLTLTSCGTDTGNPSFQASIPDNDYSQGIPFSQQVIRASCSLLTSCHSELTVERCSLNLIGLNSMVSSMGLDPDRYNHLAEVYEAEHQGALSVRPDKAELCLLDLLNLNCEDELVRSAFRPEESLPFSAAHLMIPQSCQQSFKE